MHLQAQERAEARVSTIHAELTAGQAELSALESELAHIDHLEVSV